MRDEYARQAGFAGDERTLDAHRGDALVDLVLCPSLRRGAVTVEQFVPPTSSPRRGRERGRLVTPIGNGARLEQ